MALFETVLVSDLKKPVQVKQLSGNLFSADNGGNKITVEVLDGGNAASLSGTVTGYIIRADDATVTVTGTLSSNKASIVLPASAYTVVGQVSIVIKLGTTTLGACTAHVYRTTTDTLVDPGHIIPSIAELLAKIGDCENATAAAMKVANLTVSAEAATGSTPDAVLSEVGSGSSAHKHITFKLVKGADGQNGADGEDGVSPVVVVTSITGGHQVAITDASGTSTFNVMDGTDGQDGEDGTDGVSPSVSVTSITGGHKVSITDASGTEEFDVMDGTNGQDGADGSDGQDGVSAYVHIRYASAQPTQDSDMKTTADQWMGIYAGTSSTAPTTYTSYTWYKIKGETGSAANIYGDTIEMSSSDSTKVATAIADKISKPDIAGTNGQVLTSDGQGGQSWQTPSGGTVTDVQEDGTSILNNGVANILTMTGAGSDSAGTKGLVPAPSAGDQGKVFMGSGQWSADIPNRLDALENVYTDTNVTIGTSDWTLSNGVYSYTWQSNLVTANVGVQVFLRDGAENSGIEFYEPTKVTGGVQFDTTDTPSGNFPVTIRLINTKSSQLVSLSADEVSSEAITGCDTVEEALVGLNSNITPETAIPITFPTGLTNSTDWGGSWYKKVTNHIVEIAVNANSTTKNSWIDVFTLPEGYRPSCQINYKCVGMNSTDIAHLVIKTNGDIRVYPTNSDVSNLGFVGAHLMFSV